MNNDINRNTGRTTALALSYLSEAVANPGKSIQVRDHDDKIHSHESLLSLIGKMGCQLGLDVTTNVARMTVVSTYGRPSTRYDGGDMSAGFGITNG
jgi:hypothetical protein